MQLRRIRTALGFTKLRFIELIKFDLKLPLVPVSIVLIGVAMVFNLIGKHKKTIGLMAKAYQFDWPFCEVYCLNLMKKLHDPTDIPSTKIINRIYQMHVDDFTAPEVAKKFIDNPDSFFPGMCIVLKSATKTERGVILLKYSYSFPLFIRLFQAEKIVKNYFIVLEPSWNGYLNLDILCYNLLDAPVFVQALEPRDQRFLETIGSNLKPVPLGTNWWVDYNTFKPLKLRKDIDIVMVASWADFKRHYAFFKIVKTLRSEGLKLRISLVGYPIERTLDIIRKQAVYFGIDDQIEFFEWLSPEQVNYQMNRAKINLIWSRYEGNNRVIIEGLLADLPFILREGFNYGYKYDFVNGQTGTYANEKNLGQTIRSLLEKDNFFTPRSWAMKHMTCHSAIQNLHATILDTAASCNEPFCGGMVEKVNELNGMRYFSSGTALKFNGDYLYLRSMRRV